MYTNAARVHIFTRISHLLLAKKDLSGYTSPSTLYLRRRAIQEHSTRFNPLTSYASKSSRAFSQWIDAFDKDRKSPFLPPRALKVTMSLSRKPITTTVSAAELPSRLLRPDLVGISLLHPQQGTPGSLCMCASCEPRTRNEPKRLRYICSLFYTVTGKPRLTRAHVKCPGKTQSLPANLFSASLDSSTQNTLRDAQDAIRLESQARNARELQPYAGVASPPRPDGRDPSNPFSNAPLRQDVFSGDLDWDNEFDIASSSPQAPAPFAGGFAPTLAASPTRPAPLKKRTHEHSKADNEEALDQLPELRDAMATDTTRQIRQPSRRLRPTASLCVFKLLLHPTSHS